MVAEASSFLNATNSGNFAQAAQNFRNKVDAVVYDALGTDDGGDLNSLGVAGVTDVSREDVA